MDNNSGLYYSPIVGQFRRAILVNAISLEHTRRRYTAEFKAEVALAALTER
jgi:transposase-like protein